MVLQYHPAAAQELITAIQYYEERSEGLGAEFLDEIEHTIARLFVYPESGNRVYDDDRRILLDRFPYEIVYYLHESVITVYAVRHTKREPGYWKSRK